MTISQSISTFPGPMPNRATDSPSDFSAHVDAFLGHINTHVEEINAWAGQANSLAADVQEYATSAKTYRDEAQASQNASAFSIVATYVYPQTLICTDGHAYRCLSTAGVSGENPVGSTTSNFQQITVGSVTVFDDQQTEQEIRSFALSVM